MASSTLSHIRRGLALQLPQRVFIFLIRTSATVTPILGAHFAIEDGIGYEATEGNPLSSISISSKRPLPYG